MAVGVGIQVGPRAIMAVRRVVVGVCWRISILGVGPRGVVLARRLGMFFRVRVWVEVGLLWGVGC